MENFPDWNFNFADDWQEKTLGEICDIFDGTHQTPNYTSGGVKFVSVENIKSLYATKKFISEEDFIKNHKVYPQKGDVLMTRIGDIGTPALVSTDEKLAFYVSLALFKPKNILPEYLLQVIQSEFVQRELKYRSLQNAFPKKINKSDIGKCKILIPPLEEQKKIADYLTTFDNAIAAQEKKLLNWRDVKRGLLQKIFSQEFRFTDDSGNFYSDWQEKTLSEVCEINPRGKDVPEIFNYIDLGSVVSGQLTKNIVISREKAPNRAQRLLQKNDVIFQLVRPYQKNNYIYEVETELPTVASTGYAQLRVNENIYPRFLYAVLHSEEVVKQVVFLSNGGVYPAINIAGLSTVILKIPCVEEQKKIGDYFTELDKIISAENKILENMRLMKKGLLQKLFP